MVLGDKSSLVQKRGDINRLFSVKQFILKYFLVKPTSAFKFVKGGGDHCDAVS
jgi:hypothetical protein